jgi:hypothetical protein
MTMRETALTPRRAIMIGIIGGMAALALRSGAAGQTLAAGEARGPAVHLFRVIGPRDTITVGVTAEELGGWGAGEPVTVFAARLAAAEQVTVWAYAIGRAADGSLAMTPRGRTAILRNDALRIEPYAAAHPVQAPGA